jgi:hypothetical protein
MESPVIVIEIASYAAWRTWIASLSRGVRSEHEIIPKREAQLEPYGLFPNVRSRLNAALISAR